MYWILLTLVITLGPLGIFFLYKNFEEHKKKAADESVGEKMNIITSEMTLIGLIVLVLLVTFFLFYYSLNKV